MAQWWYNYSYHTSLKLSPFEALFGYAPPQFGISTSKQGVNADVDNYLEPRKVMKSLMKESLEMAQQSSIQVRRNLKLSVKFFGPYQVEEKVGKVAYRLKLPEGSKIHPTFHVSQIKPKLRVGVMPQTNLPATTREGELKMKPIQVLDTRKIKKNSQIFPQLLIQWEGSAVEEATWEDKHYIKLQFPKLILEDKNLQKERELS
ncbi:uncharacterized protein LOC113352366 [Papaver somniferum]|uniref:uncharacterized protein LOC113352366 n=1 Tax=Papaver somniferum TaxID=3469 RepID=UPI000E7040B0|nr:uncharacterized protein LOC113352366 [Papaver somniferum]